jgi:hypothetical protein
MIRWLWSRMMKWGWDYSREVDDGPLIRKHRVSRYRDDIVSIDDYDSGIDLNNPIMFRVQAVSGGTLIETRWYDHNTDNNERKLHIVNNDENLAEAIGKIVTMELLKR